MCVIIGLIQIKYDYWGIQSVSMPANLTTTACVQIVLVLNKVCYNRVDFCINWSSGTKIMKKIPRYNRNMVVLLLCVKFLKFLFVYMSSLMLIGFFSVSTPWG